MLCHSLFRIFLHIIVYGGIYLESVSVQIIFRSVCLGVLVEPAVKSVVGPLERVHHIVLILGIRRPFRLLGVHGTSQHVPEIRADSCIVVLHLIRKFYRKKGDGVLLVFGQESRLLHLGEDEISSDK